MKNWEYKKLSDVANFRNGVAHEKEIEKEGQFIVVNSKFVSSNGESKKYTNEFLSPLHKDEVVFVMSDVPKGKTLAKCFIIDNENLYSLNQRICAFSNIKTDLKFFYYYINRNKYFLSFDNGENQTNLRKNDILNCPFPLPPLEEQKRIVKILDEKFAQLETVKANAKANLQNAKDLFQSQLTKAFSNTTWEKKRLGDICEVKSGGTPSRTNKLYWDNGNIPWVKTTELQNNIISDTEEYITEKGLEESSAKIVPKGTILLAMYGQGKTRGMTAYLDIEATTNQACACILPPKDKNISTEYIWKYLIGNYENIRNLAIGCNQPNLNSIMVKSIEIPLPPLSEQKRIVEQLDSLSEKVRSLEEIYTKQLANCDELKQAFLAKAFNGEL